MRTTTRPWTMLVAGVLSLLMTSCFTSELILLNDTSDMLTPYPVVTSPPPPHREADPANELPAGQTRAIDPDGFNPLFYTSAITDPARANAIHIGLDLYDQTPGQILYRLFHYPVPPDQVGTDPANQPILIKEGIEDVPDEDTVIELIEGVSDTPGLLTWRVKIAAQ